VLELDLTRFTKARFSCAFVTIIALITGVASAVPAALLVGGITEVITKTEVLTETVASECNQSCRIEAYAIESSNASRTADKANIEYMVTTFNVSMRISSKYDKTYRTDSGDLLPKSMTSVLVFNDSFVSLDATMFRVLHKYAEVFFNPIPNSLSGVHGQLRDSEPYTSYVTINSTEWNELLDVIDWGNGGNRSELSTKNSANQTDALVHVKSKGWFNSYANQRAGSDVVMWVDDLQTFQKGWTWGNPLFARIFDGVAYVKNEDANAFAAIRSRSVCTRCGYWGWPGNAHVSFYTLETEIKESKHKVLITPDNIDDSLPLTDELPFYEANKDAFVVNMNNELLGTPEHVYNRDNYNVPGGNMPPYEFPQ
jgi:hypothetical protein